MAARNTPDINRILRAAPRVGYGGAPLGATNYDERGPEYHGLGYYSREFYCQRVRFIDGAYGPDGTYWGTPANLWCIFARRAGFDRLPPGHRQTDALALRWYVRAPTRKAALELFHQENSK